MIHVKDILFDWRLHVSVLVITALAEMIGVIAVPIGIGTVMLLPLLYAFVMGLVLNPNVVSKSRGWLGKREVRAASPLIVVAIMPFIAKFGVAGQELLQGVTAKFAAGGICQTGLE